MSSQLMFFATRNDLLPVLQDIERAWAVKYSESGFCDSGLPRSFADAASIPDLGIAARPSSTGCRSYLISPIDQQVRVRMAGNSPVVDQLENADTVEFSPGGLWGSDILLDGRFATVSSGSFSAEVMKALRAAIRKRFDKVKVFYVGEEAQRMLDAGKRLTSGEQTPRSYDLAR